ncbi:MAG: endolytic transglycosylase MltG, partial [Eggerthellaceae bacterium]|nr:endolytic transglycosylase MltG [Eggerthellaceae bacterium]
MTPRRRQVTYSSRPNHAARSAHAKGARQFRTYDTSALRPKKSIGPKIFAAVLAVVVIGGMVFGGMTLMKGCSPQATLPEGETVEVIIPDGAGAKAIGKQLQEAGLIGTSAEFMQKVSEMGVEAQLCSGTYTFTGGMTVGELIGQLRLGPVSTDDPGVPMTIPEGFTIKQIASRVEETTEGRISAADFTAAASDASVYAADFTFLSEAGTNSLEGFLFPKTYNVPDDATAESLVRR